MLGSCDTQRAERAGSPLTGMDMKGEKKYETRGDTYRLARRLT